MPSSDKPTRKLAAIMFTDIVGFTKIMTTSEDTAINILQVQDKIFNPILEKHSGNLLKKMGDGLLIEFSSAVNAFECALKIQSAIKEYNKTDGDDFDITGLFAPAFSGLESLFVIRNSNCYINPLPIALRQ